MCFFNQSIEVVKGIGPKKAGILRRLGICTIMDALYYFPRDYEIWEGIKSVSSISEEREISLLLKFQGKPQATRIKKNLTITSWKSYDHSGQVWCVWYNQPYRAMLYKNNQPYFVRGKVSLRNGKIQIQNPVVEDYNPSKHDMTMIVPLYPLSQGITQNDFKKIMNFALNMSDSPLIDLLPPIIRNEYELADIDYSLYHIHFPKSLEDLNQAKRRFIFEELFFMQVALKYMRREIYNNSRVRPFEWDSAVIGDFVNSLPFSLTSSQRNALADIKSDLTSGRVMNRLIQGDVGCGKTILSVITLYCAVLNGYQGTILVPTEVLAEQHYESFCCLLRGKNIRVECLTGSMSSHHRKKIIEGIKNGDIHILVGTHAILQEAVNFERLRVVVTDEQHRFGVRQRALLKEKGVTPHMLVMSATPIPRTLSLVFHGDLDVSVISQLPPGRKPVKTYHAPISMEKRVHTFIEKQIKTGRQAYIICPMIEDSDTIDSQSAISLFKTLTKGPLGQFRLELLHGRLKPSDKEKVMKSFLKGEIQVLISTTVIEVGVNVPNATIMLIYNADRFGLAQLHQLRGRVGRSAYQSYCILLSNTKNEEAIKRLDTLVRSNNGFDIAQKDLEMRGPGDFLGLRQHGFSNFKIAELPRDLEILKQAQSAAEKMIELCLYEPYKTMVKEIYNKFKNLAHEISIN